jgi:hypothetical protein
VDINHLNKSVKSNDIETVIKKLPIKKSSASDGFAAEFYQTFKEELTQMFLKLFQKIERERTLQTHSTKPGLSKYQNQITKVTS